MLRPFRWIAPPTVAQDGMQFDVRPHDDIVDRGDQWAAWPKRIEAGRGVDRRSDGLVHGGRPGFAVGSELFGPCLGLLNTFPGLLDPVPGGVGRIEDIVDQPERGGGGGGPFHGSPGRLPAGRDFLYLVIGGFDGPDLAGQGCVKFLARREELMPFGL